MPAHKYGKTPGKTARTARRSAVALATAAVVGAGVMALPSAQADPAPSLTDVKNAFNRVEAASEQANSIKQQISSTRADIDAMSADIAAQRKQWRAQRDQLSASIVQQQMDSPLGSTVSLLGSKSPQTFLDGLSAIQALNSTQADELAAFSKSTKELANRRAQLTDREDDLKADEKDAAAKQAEIKAKYAKAKAEYDRLTAQQQAGFDTGSVKVGFEVSASGAAKKALDFALAQLGDAYVWGGTGPNSWDCSGLVMMAYKAAGINIGRVTYDQIKQGHEVSMSDLQPGDLVFYGSLSHVGMYVGKGKVVNAARPGVGVVISSLAGFSRARRIA